MGTKLIALYTQPNDPEAFEKRYFEGHVPFVKKLPGIRGVEISRGRGKDAPYYLMAEMAFDSVDDLRAALRSPEMAATAADVQEFAGDLLTIFQVETLDFWEPESDAV
jgi:uncharacterized protein (TIGR02118 family)